MNRAGLFNFWYYSDEIFEFSDGKLLLRGSNGSGKSVTMQSILPILLDGRKSPDRLDPFGSRARKMEDYLLGEKEIVDRDERTGYLFLEYKREDTNQYITTGIGLQARRYKNLNSWYFVITDNRRIGENLFLYEHEYEAGEKQQIPLSRVQLENRIGDGGQVVRTQGDYAKLVNKHIFGFEEMEAYEDLIKLLIQLRSPKLSKDFRPTVIYEILEAALPPLTDEDLRHLSDTIEQMDLTKQQIEQLDREKEALDEVVARYDTYNRYRLAETARHYREAKRKFSKEEKISAQKAEEKLIVENKVDSLSERFVELEQLADTLEKKQKRLEQHEVWDLEAERSAEQERLQQIKTDFSQKDQTVTAKANQQLTMKNRVDELNVKLVELDSEMTDQLDDLTNDALETSFDRHELNVEDFERKKLVDFDFTVWKKEAEQHYDLLDAVSEKLRTFQHLKEQIAVVEKRIADSQQQLDQKKHEERDWEAVFEKDKQEKLTEIYHWVEDHPFLNVPETVLQQASRLLGQLYETHSFESVRTPFVQVANDYERHINESIATKQSEQKQLQNQVKEQEELLAEWQAKKDPEPPFQREETKEARRQLTEKQQAHISFYEAVEFYEHVDEEVRRQIEAALIDGGMLDALIVEGDVIMKHDRILQPKAHMMAHTLADYLRPDVGEDDLIAGSTVDEVLRSILVDADGENSETTIGIDGTYKIGLLSGHAVPVESVRFIGKNARQRYREEQIKLITAEIEHLSKEVGEIFAEIEGLQEKISVARDSLEVFPNDLDLQTSFAEIESCRFQIGQIEKQLLSDDGQLNHFLTDFHRVKRQLDDETRGLAVEFSYEAYQKAKHIHRRYEKEVGQLEKIHVTYQHEMANKLQMVERVDELEEEITLLKGEVNQLTDQKTRTENNIAEIEKQLVTAEMDDIREQIQTVQREIGVTNKELSAIRDELPVLRAQVGILDNDITKQEQQLKFSQVLINAWQTSYMEEINYGFIEVPEKLDEESALTWIIKEYRPLINDAMKIEDQLNKVYFEQQSNLMEYRMTEQPTSMPEVAGVDSDDWLEDQQILLQNWQSKATRRIIQLDMQGQRLSPYYVQQKVEEDRVRQQTYLNTQDRQLYEEILFYSVGNKLRSRITRAEQWTKEMDKLMKKSDSTSGISFSIQWKPRTAETEVELDTKDLVDLLRRDPRLLKEEDLNKVMEHFRSKIDRAKELIEVEGSGDTLLQVLKNVLDYRYWFSFILSYQRGSETKRELTNNAFHKFSGGEKAMAMYIPLFTACYSRYLEADEKAPYIISLDEAFAGVDDENISSMFRIVEELGFDYMMNSQVLWGDYSTVSSLAISELVRPKNADFVTVIRYEWDGHERKLVDLSDLAVEAETIEDEGPEPVEDKEKALGRDTALEDEEGKETVPEYSNLQVEFDLLSDK